jgi:ribosomal protein S18 acetylase RimI-like enzyme
MTGSERSIRRATPGEADAIRAMVRSAYAKYVDRIGREPAPMTADYAAEIAAGAVWVAADGDGEPVGVVVLHPEPAYLLLDNVAVDPEHQGRGIGRALIRFAEERASALGLAEVRLYTNEKMTENIALYRSLGYVEVDRRRGEGFDRVWFAKRVG